MVGNKLSCSQKIKVSGKLFRWEANIFYNDIKTLVWNFLTFFLIIACLTPNNIKPLI